MNSPGNLLKPGRIKCMAVLTSHSQLWHDNSQLHHVVLKTYCTRHDIKMCICREWSKFKEAAVSGFYPSCMAPSEYPYPRLAFYFETLEAIKFTVPIIRSIRNLLHARFFRDKLHMIQQINFKVYLVVPMQHVKGRGNEITITTRA